MMRRVGAVVVAVSVGAGVVARAATFWGLGSLSTENFVSNAGAVTDDLVVGGSTALPGGGHGAYLWDTAGGMRAIGVMSVRNISANGTMVVGHSASSQQRPAYWTEATGVRTLPVLSTTGPGQASAVSVDGRVIVGETAGPFTAGSTNPLPSRRAVRWVDGAVQDLGFLDVGSGQSGGRSWALDVSADGKVIVGAADTPVTTAYGVPRSMAFRWTEETGMVALGDLPGGEVQSTGQAVSADGRVIVGTSVGANGNEAFRWTEAAGMVGIGRPAGVPDVYVTDMSADGSVIVGDAIDQSSAEPWRAVVWDAARGWRDVKGMLEGEYGLDLTGWTLYGASRVSPDGGAIVGSGKNPEGKTEGWLAVVPGLRVAGADANGDGRIDGEDYALVDRGYAMGLSGWGNGDFDGDGVVDAADYLRIDVTFARQEGAVPASLLAVREGQFGGGYVAELVAAVPEPAAAGVVGTVGLVVGMGRRRRG